MEREIRLGLSPTRLTPTPKGNYFRQCNPDPNAVAMKQSLSTVLVLALVALISQPGAAQQAQPSPTPGGRGGRGGGPPAPITAQAQELAKIRGKTEQLYSIAEELTAERA